MPDEKLSDDLRAYREKLADVGPTDSPDMIAAFKWALREFDATNLIKAAETLEEGQVPEGTR